MVEGRCARSRSARTPREPQAVDTALAWRYGGWTIEGLRRWIAGVGPWMLADTPGGREELLAIVDPRLRDVVETLSPSTRSMACTFTVPWIMGGSSREDALAYVIERVRDESGTVVGTLMQVKPNLGMATIGAMVGQGDPRHFERMNAVAAAGRRPAAILFADLEHSSELARRVSTASYFTFVRRLVRAADQAVIDSGGARGPTRRRRRGGVLPRPNRRFRVCRGTRLHRRSPGAQCCARRRRCTKQTAGG